MTAYETAMTEQPDSMDLIMGGYKDLVAMEKEPLLFLFPSHSSFFYASFSSTLPCWGNTVQAF